MNTPLRPPVWLRCRREREGQWRQARWNKQRTASTGAIETCHAQRATGKKDYYE